MKTIPYNKNKNILEGKYIMPKRKILHKNIEEPFGKRLARLRHDAGFSQRELASEMGISHRMVAYYEKDTSNAPSHLLPLFATALGVTIEQLLGVETIKEKTGQIRDSRLWRRFSQVEKLPPEQRKPIVQILDAFLKKEGANK